MCGKIYLVFKLQMGEHFMWTEKDIENIKAMYDNGYTISELAIYFDTDIWNIRKALALAKRMKL